MDFLIVIRSDNPQSQPLIFEAPFHSPPHSDGQNYIQYYRRKPGDFIYRYENAAYQHIILGDLIIPVQYRSREEFCLKTVCDDFKPESLRHLNGFFYLIRVDKQRNEIEVFNSLFSILSVYVYQSNNAILISSRIDLIANSVQDTLTINKRFILEKILFNYPLFNQTAFEEIDLLPSNHFLSFSNGRLQYIRHIDITSYFVEQPQQWKKSLDAMRDLFLEVVRDYFADKLFSISFTGGFDGRALVAAAFNSKKQFETYAFGSPDSEDVLIPLNIANELNIPFTPIWLDDDYIENHFLDNGKDLINLTNGIANIGRAHYLYAVKALSEKLSYIISGNFGSELFRAVHVRGVVTTETLIDIFSASDDDVLIERIKNNEKLQLLKAEAFDKVLDQTMDEIIQMRRTLNKGMALNQIFYQYIFEETFRKYFGAEIVAESYHLDNRTPYLNFEFIEALLKTEMAGVNNSFLEDNPLKRFRGQVLYAHVIKRAFPALAGAKTGRGYSPADLLSFTGRINVSKAYLSKKALKSTNQIDPFAVNGALTFHSDTLIDWLDYPELFNLPFIKEKIQETGWRYLQNEMVTVVSISRFLKDIMKSNRATVIS